MNPAWVAFGGILTAIGVTAVWLLIEARRHF